ncbi:MAG: hypothetical protein QOJ50_3394 [Cryptosporangiaceae bacterium]|nr:hypothetical protein [Cryptosporangiaceae bacterium]
MPPAGPGTPGGYSGQPPVAPGQPQYTQVLPAGTYVDPAYGSPQYAPPGYPPQGPYGNDPYAANPYGYGPPPKKRSRGPAIVGGGLLVLALCAGGGFYAAHAFTSTTKQDASVNVPLVPLPEPSVAAPSPDVSPSPDVTPSPSDQASPGAAGLPGQTFADPDLRDFAGNRVQNAQCTEQQPASLNLSGVTEAVSCQFKNFTVRYLKWDGPGSRDQYFQSVSGGLGGQVNVERNAVWANRRGEQQGRFVSGSQSNDSQQYVYWNSFTATVSGELVIAGSRRSNAENAWRSL